MAHSRFPIFFVAICALGLSGCTTKVAEPSGFLGNVGQLQRGKKVGRPDFEYRSAQNLPVAKGTTIYVEPVVVRLGEDRKADTALRRRLGDGFTTTLREQLDKEFAVVDKAKGATLRVRTVVTELKPGAPALNLATAIYPSTRISSELKRAVSGEQAFTGAAATEIEVVRIADGRRIYAMMDYATARKTIGTAGSKWAPVEKLCEHWARDLSELLGGPE